MLARKWTATCALCVVTGGCTTPRPAPTEPTGRTLEHDRSEAEAELDSREAAAQKSVAVPADAVARAAGALIGYRSVDGREFDFETLVTHLASADAICIGERHDRASDHYVELRTIQALLERRAMRGFELGLGLEMIRQQHQPVLRKYLEGGLGDEGLRDETNFDAEWGFSFAYYQPQLHETLLAASELLALGLPEYLAQDIAEKSLWGLSPNERRQLPAVDLADAEHRALFDSLMQGHPGELDAAALDRLYEAQVVRDENMAALSSAWLSARYPGRKLVILAGAEHCHPRAIPARIARRAAFSIVTLLPSSEGDAADPDRARLAQSYDYRLVVRAPGEAAPGESEAPDAAGSSADPDS